MLPHLLEYAILPHGYTLLSKLCFLNKKLWIKECCKLKNVNYMRDINGNTPLLYSLKRKCYETIDELLLFISERRHLINKVSLAALCRMMELAPSNLIYFFQKAVTPLNL